MARFKALVLAGAIGAIVGTILRPGVFEIIFVAVLLVVTATLARWLPPRHVPFPAE